MVVENAFGILASWWRIFHRSINLHPQNVDTLVTTICILHTFLLPPSENVRLLEEAGGGGQGFKGDLCCERVLCNFLHLLRRQCVVAGQDSVISLKTFGQL